MWAKPVTVTPPAAEPITLAQAKQFLRIDLDDDGFDTEVALLITGSRDDIESTTSTRLVEQTVDVQAETFVDLSRLPIGPVTELVSVTYQDRAGDEIELPVDSIELFGAGLEMGVRPIAGGRWPTKTTGVVTVRLVVGYGADNLPIPSAVMTGLLLQIRALFDDATFDLERWLVNDRIWL